MRRLFLLAIMLLCWTARAQADGEGRLSDRGRRMVNGSLGGSWYNRDGMPSATGASSRWALWALPSFVYFLSNRAGVGGYVGYENNHGDFVEQENRWVANTVSTGVLGSFEVVASGAWGLFLNTSFGYAWSRRSSRFSETSPYRSEYGGADRLIEHDRRIQIGLRLPLTYHVSSSVGFGLGPDLLLEFVSYEGNRVDAALRTRLGLSSWIAYSF